MSGLRDHSSHDMAFPHPQSRKHHHGNEDIPGLEGVVWKLFKRAIDVTEDWDGTDDVNPAKNCTRDASVRDVRLTRGGICRYHLVVKIDKASDGEPKNIIMGAFGGHYDVKQVVVVDMDVDIDNPNEIEWAVATRFQADRDLVIVSGAQGSKLDPSSQDGISAKMGIDATKPVSTEPMAFKRIHVKGVENVDLGRMLQGNPKAAFARVIAS